MAGDPFTLHIFLPDGDPDGVRIIDRMNWTGLGVGFPRDKWNETRHRKEFEQAGIYILKGYQEEEEDLPTLYVGQGDGVKSRIDSHYQSKSFWDWGIAFVSTSGGLNRAHITWLEYALIERAKSAQRCHLDNGNTPQEPALSESEKADTRAFLKEILQILPLVGIHAFEIPKPITSSNAFFGAGNANLPESREKDTIVVPAQKEGFERVFLGEDCWYAIRISGGMQGKIKYIAAYQTQPVSAITHYAEVDRIEPYGDSGKFKVIFSGKAREISPIPFKDAISGSMQGPRYTNFEKLKLATNIGHLF
jgi:hypothetical protein